MLHADDAGEAFAVDVPEDIAVIDFAGARLIAARVIADLEIGDFVPDRKSVV